MGYLDEPVRLAKYAKMITSCADPLAYESARKMLTCKKVVRAYDPDERGLVEVLYLDGEGIAQTAYLRDDVVVYVVAGW